MSSKARQGQAQREKGEDIYTHTQKERILCLPDNTEPTIVQLYHYLLPDLRLPN